MTSNLGSTGRAGSIFALALALATGVQAAAKPVCDRACLIKMTDRYIASFTRHDPSTLPLAPGFEVVENAKRIKPGEGLWRDTTSGPTRFSIHVPDPVNQSAGWMGMMQKAGKPVQVAIRLTLEKGKIVRAEHRIGTVRDADLARLETPRPGLRTDVPTDKRISHAAMIRIGGSYYDAVDDNDGTKMPFAADCQRQESGMVTAGAGAGTGPASKDVPPIASDCAGQLSSGVMGYISPIDERHVFAADPQTGLVMGFSILRHPMDFDPYPVRSIDGTVTLFAKERFGYKPFDNVAAHIWKIGADGKVHEIEAMGFQLPYPAPTGWENVPER